MDSECILSSKHTCIQKVSISFFSWPIQVGSPNTRSDDALLTARPWQPKLLHCLHRSAALCWGTASLPGTCRLWSTGYPQQHCYAQEHIVIASYFLGQKSLKDYQWIYLTVSTLVNMQHVTEVCINNHTIDNYYYYLCLKIYPFYYLNITECTVLDWHIVYDM